MSGGPIAVLGAGWVGLVTAACLAELGRDVVVRDVDPARVEGLRAGRMPIYEPGLAELIAANRARLVFTLDAAEVFRAARAAFVCVGTPPTHSGDADLSAVWRVLDEIPDGTEAILVMKSTVPVGTGARVRAQLAARGLDGVGYASNPEFLAEGTALVDFRRPDRLVIGDFVRAHGDEVAALYAGLGDVPVVRTDVASAEMIKYASNAFLATKISFINEIANVCEETGADVTVVAQGMGLDRRIGPHFLRAGLGFGGSCFPKDVAALKQLAGNSGYHFQLLTAVIDVNELQKRRVVGKLVKHLGPLAGKTITLLGLAFKPDTSDMREAASLVLAARLASEGAHVRGWDPVALEDARALLPGVELYDDLLASLEGADAAVIVTEWEAVRRFPYDRAALAMRSAVLVDGRNVLDPDEARAATFVYESIGRPSLV
jgi:UDPglucose 6-dehydrogenase